MYKRPTSLHRRQGECKPRAASVSESIQQGSNEQSKNIFFRRYRGTYISDWHLFTDGKENVSRGRLQSQKAFNKGTTSSLKISVKGGRHRSRWPSKPMVVRRNSVSVIGATYQLREYNFPPRIPWNIRTCHLNCYPPSALWEILRIVMDKDQRVGPFKHFSRKGDATDKIFGDTGSVARRREWALLCLREIHWYYSYYHTIQRCWLSKKKS